MNIKELREIAEAANQGRWYWLDDNMYADPAIEPHEHNEKGSAIIQTDSGYYGPGKPERAHIATFNPARVKALLDCVEALQSLTSPIPTDGEFIDAIEKSAAALKALEAA